MKHLLAGFIAFMVFVSPTVLFAQNYEGVCAQTSHQENAKQVKGFVAELHVRVAVDHFDEKFGLISNRGTARIKSIQGKGFELEITSAGGDPGFYVKDPQGDGYVDHRWKGFGWDKAEQDDTYKACRYLEEVAVRLFYEDLRD